MDLTLTENLMDSAVIYEELGRGPVPGPHFSSGVLGALILMENATTLQKQTFLPEIAQGRAIVSVAVNELDYGWESQSVQVTANWDGAKYNLSGTKLHVQDADFATHLIVAARTTGSGGMSSGVSLFLVETSDPGVHVQQLEGFLTGSSAIVLDNVRAVLVGDAEDNWFVLENVFQKAAPILCAYQVGGLSQVFDMSLAYSQTRHQFQQPIGRFQRVQDHVIDIVNQLDAARWTTYEALWKMDNGAGDAIASVHMAAAVTSEAYYAGCNSAHDVHAGVGIVREYGLTLHTKMSRTLYHYLGNPRHHKRKLAEALKF